MYNNVSDLCHFNLFYSFYFIVDDVTNVRHDLSALSGARALLNF